MATNCPEMFSYLTSCLNRKNTGDHTTPGAVADGFRAFGSKYINKWDFIGALSTSLAMVGQALFAAIYIFAALESLGLPIEAVATVALIMLYAAYKGKREIVRFFNKWGFIALADKDWHKQFITSWDKAPNWLNALLITTNILATLAISLTFMGLSVVSFHGIGQLLIDHNWVAGFGHFLQNTTGMSLATLLFGLPSFFANMVSFPKNIHAAGVEELFRIFFMNPYYRMALSEQNSKLGAVISAHKAQAELAMKIRGETTALAKNGLLPIQITTIGESTEKLEAQYISFGATTDNASQNPRTFEALGPLVTKTMDGLKTRALESYSEEHHGHLLKPVSWAEYIARTITYRRAYLRQRCRLIQLPTNATTNLKNYFQLYRRKHACRQCCSCCWLAILCLDGINGHKRYHLHLQTHHGLLFQSH